MSRTPSSGKSPVDIFLSFGMRNSAWISIAMMPITPRQPQPISKPRPCAEAVEGVDRPYYIALIKFTGNSASRLCQDFVIAFHNAQLSDFAEPPRLCKNDKMLNPRLWLIVIAALALLSFSRAKAAYEDPFAPPFSTADLCALCTHAPDANDNTGPCNSFIEGVLNYYVALTGAKYDRDRQMTQFCAPSWFTPSHARPYFVKYCEEHPNDRTDSPSTSLISALAENFPCTPHPWFITSHNDRVRQHNR